MSVTAELPFSKLRHAAGLVFLSGELPLAPDGSIPAGIGAQTELTLNRIAATLSSAGLGLADIVQATIYLTHPDDFAEFNAAYRNHFQPPYPVRTTLVAPLVVPTARIEITVVAGASQANMGQAAR